MAEVQEEFNTEFRRQTLQKVKKIYESPLGVILIGEFLGTAVFTYGIAASGGWGSYISGTLFVVIVILANWTGGHVNPAVSLGFLIKGEINIYQFCCYVVA